MDGGFSTEQAIPARDFVTYVMRDMAGLWAEHGWNRTGRFGYERLEESLTPSALGFRRSMAVARQIFLFSHAWRITGDDLFADRAHALFADLTERFWDAQHGGWFFSLGDDGKPADATKDFYGHAFVLFGLAHYASIFNETRALDWARRTDELVKTKLWLDRGWGAQTAARDWTPLESALAQNPHMHLLEAYLSLHAASGDPAFLHDAERLIALYGERLCAPDGAKVIEHFDALGRPHAGKGRLIEPGHSYEWYWLLHEYADAADLPEYKTIAASLLTWAEAYGIDAHYGGIYGTLDINGAVVDERKRIWPVTECIKANAALARHTGSADAYAKVADWITFITKTYFAGQGRWHEFVRRDLKPDSDFMPSSTPYHIAMAALEVDRLLGGPGAFNLQRAGR